MIRRIAIVGAECTGKTWLTEQLAALLRSRGQNAHAVPEHLRLWCDHEGRTPRQHEQQAIAQSQAQAVLCIDQGTVLADTTPLMTAVYSHMVFGDTSLYPMALEHQQLYAQTLLTGLDIAWEADGFQRDGPQVRGTVDRLLRQALERSGIAYRVIYGQGHTRLNNALIALNLTPEDDAARQAREAAQYDLNSGRTRWNCEKCSEPACEHRLFTDLLKRPTP